MNRLDNVEDVLLPKAPLLVAELRALVHRHFDNFLAVVLRDQYLLLPGYWRGRCLSWLCWFPLGLLARALCRACSSSACGGQHLLLEALSESNRVKLARLVVDLGVVVPRLVVVGHHFSGSAAVPDRFVEIFTGQLRALIQGHILNLCLPHILLHRGVLLHRDLMLDLLVLEIEVPLAQFQVAVAELLGILDFLAVDHFL